jgi:hypothetical protein
MWQYRACVHIQPTGRGTGNPDTSPDSSELMERNSKLKKKRLYKYYYHVYRVCVTDNNGFWIRWIDLLDIHKS